MLLLWRLETGSWRTCWLPFIFKLALRNILRNPYRGLFVILGATIAICLVLTATVFLDSIEYVMDLNFNKISAYDAKLVFKTIGDAGRAVETGQWNGVAKSEPILEVPYRFKYGEKYQDGVLVGLPPSHSLYNLFDLDGRPVKVESGQLLLSPYIVKKLGVEAGDDVKLEPLLGTTREKQVKFGGLVQQPLINAGYLPLKEVQAILQAPGSATGLLIDFTGGVPSPALVKKFYNIPETESVQLIAEAKRFIDEMMGFFYIFVGFMLAFGISLGAVIIFSGLTVSVDERILEMGTLRTIGMTLGQIIAVITIESMILSGVGIAIGLPLGNWLASGFMKLYESEDISMKAIIFFRTYVLTVVSLLAVTFIAELPSLRRLSRLDLAAAIRQWFT